MPTGLITAERLRLFAPHCDYLAVAPALDAAAQAHGISTPRRIRHWLAQMSVESAGFTRLEEDLTYTTPERICAVWPSRFPTIAAATPFLRNPRGLAERVYGGRGGNDVAGDGWRYRGRSWMDITFKRNYGRASAWCGLDLVAQPDQAADPKVASTIAAAFWEMEGLNEAADADAGEKIYATIEAGVRGNELDDLKQETLTVNGGLTGWPDRQRQLLRAATIWKDAA